MYDIEKIKRNICLELRSIREELDDDDYQQLIMNNQKLVINFENNEVFTMEKNSYLNPQDERINNIEYFPIPNHSDIDAIINNDDNSFVRSIEEHYEYEIILQKEEEEKIFLAQNTTNRDLLKILAKENDEDINYQIAKNENTPLEVLKYLRSYDIYDDVLNENYSFKKYEELMNDEDFRDMETIKQESIIKIFRMINNKEDISIEQYNIFMEIDYGPLLKKIASYEKTPAEILNKLYDLDTNKYDLSLAGNPNSPQNIIEKLAMKGEYFLYINLAGNPNCPQDLLKAIAKINDEYINVNLASNPNCPQDLLKAIAKINDEYINVKLAGNPNCPQNILEGLSEEVIRKKEYNNKPYFEISDYVEPSYNDFER